MKSRRSFSGAPAFLKNKMNFGKIRKRIHDKNCRATGLLATGRLILFCSLIYGIPKPCLFLCDIKNMTFKLSVAALKISGALDLNAQPLMDAVICIPIYPVLSGNCNASDTRNSAGFLDWYC